jgi:DNA-binding MarR family transcriptional regulator/GNAT superfamily N-acetyltransferase
MAGNSEQADSGALAARVQSVWRFNRFYTKQIGVLRRGLLSSRFSLTQVRVMSELSSGECKTAADLITKLGLDAGYVSRMLREFRNKGLVERSRSNADGRQNLLRLTSKGRKEFATLNTRQNKEVKAMLRRLPSDEQHRLVQSMHTIRRLVQGPAVSHRPYILRPHRPGDMGWVLERHAMLYAREHGWDERFEALVARIIADFIDGFDSQRERCWIAEMDNERVGSVFLIKHSSTVSKLHLLLVEPEARGCGIGEQLVSECIRFARQAGYQKITLRTNSVLHAARNIYEHLGFKLVEAKRHKKYGRGLIGETWGLSL